MGEIDEEMIEGSVDGDSSHILKSHKKKRKSQTEEIPKSNKKKRKSQKEENKKSIKQEILKKADSSSKKAINHPTEEGEISTTEGKSKKRKATEADLERKREKTRLNNLRKRQLKSGKIPTAIPTPTLDPKKLGGTPSVSPSPNNNEKLALEYLKLWKTNKDLWKFQKRRQIWLSKNMYNSSKISDDDFEILLEYVTSMKGNARENVLKNAETYIKNMDEKWEQSTTKDEDDCRLYERARQIIQLL